MARELSAPVSIAILDEFVQYLDDAGHSQNTCFAYRSDVLCFFRMLAVKSRIDLNSENEMRALEHARADTEAQEATRVVAGVDLSPYVATSVTELVVEMANRSDATFVSGFVDTLHERRHGTATILRKIMAIRHFFRWLHDGARIARVNLALTIKTVKHYQKPFKTVSDSDLEALLGAPESTTFKGLRDRAILQLLANIPVSPSEVCAMNIADFDRVALTVVVRRCKNREVSGIQFKVPECVRVSLLSYLNHQVTQRMSRKHNGPSPLFFSTHGLRIHNRTIRRNVVAKYVQMAGLNKSITARTISHTYAEKLMAGGGKLKDVGIKIHARVHAVKLRRRLGFVSINEAPASGALA